MSLADPCTLELGACVGSSKSKAYPLCYKHVALCKRRFMAFNTWALKLLSLITGSRRAERMEESRHGFVVSHKAKGRESKGGVALMASRRINLKLYNNGSAPVYHQRFARPRRNSVPLQPAEHLFKKVGV